jgi:small basic protein
MKVLVTLATISVAVAILPLPYGFYMLLRVIICLTAVMGFIRAREEQRTTWLWIYVVIAVLYNPVLPAHLILKPLWFVANLVTIVLLWVGLSKFGNRLPRI